MWRSPALPRLPHLSCPIGVTTAAVPQAILGQTSGAHAVAPLVDGDLALGSRMTLASGKCDQRVAGDAFEDRAGQVRGDDGVVVEGKEQVQPAKLLDPPMLDDVQDDDLIATVVIGIANGRRAACVAPRKPCSAGAARGGARAVLRHIERGTLQTAVETLVPSTLSRRT